MKIIISFGILFLLFHQTILSQDDSNYSYSDSLTPKPSNIYELLNSFQYKEIDNNYLETMVDNSNEFRIDNLKYIYELIMLNKLLQGGLDNFNNLTEQKRSQSLILLTGKNYYGSQPNYDLGIVGKYLGISKNLFALILAIISL